MTDDPTPLDQIEPIGRPVEEIEQESRNLDASRTAPSSDRDDDRIPIAPYNTGTGTATAGAGGAAPSIPALDDDADKTDGRDR